MVIGCWRVARGYVSKRRVTELDLALLWNGYAAGAVAVTLALTLLLAAAGGPA